MPSGHQDNLDNEPIDPEFRKLYPQMSDAEMRTAQRNLKRYVEILYHIYQRRKDEDLDVDDKR